jgi:hypothetical protein
MPAEQPRYVIFVDQEGQEGVMLTAPLDEDDREYFVKGVLPTLRPLSDEDYMNGPAVILHSWARFSYILMGRTVYWCAEWQPGLIVVRFSPDGQMAWSGLRSPIPNFGGRTPNAEDLQNADEDAENHQYNLIFHAWDAQFEEDTREWRSFRRADNRTAEVYKAALAHVQALGEQMEARYSGTDRFNPWADRCKANLTKWAGEGIRVAY